MIRPLFIPHRDGEIINGELIESSHFTIFASENMYTKNAVNVPLNVNASVEKLTNLLEGHINPEIPAEFTQVNINSLEENIKAQNILKSMLAQGLDLSPLNYDVPISTNNLKQSQTSNMILVGPTSPSNSENISTEAITPIPLQTQNPDTRMTDEQIQEMHKKGIESGKIEIVSPNGMPIGTSENYLPGLFRSPDVSKIEHVTIEDFLKPDEKIVINNSQELKTPEN